MAIKELRSIQEIFSGRFSKARFAVVQKCREEGNEDAMRRGYTEHWAAVDSDTDLIAIEFLGSPLREIWVGKFSDQQVALLDDDKKQFYRIYVDQFQLVGIHNCVKVSDANFYGTKGGGGARVKVAKATLANSKNITNSSSTITPPGEMVERMVWLRKNHKLFRDPVTVHWGNKCAVTRDYCEGLLVASHIKPWSVSSPIEQTDLHNGLLLCAPLDALFDKGFIGFSDAGNMLCNKDLKGKFRRIFGIKPAMTLDKNLINKKMQGYLKWHRERYGLSS